jgi:hypothetical protein
MKQTTHTRRGVTTINSVLSPNWKGTAVFTKMPKAILARMYLETAAYEANKPIPRGRSAQTLIDEWHKSLEE